MKIYLFFISSFLSITALQAQTLDLATCFKMADSANITLRNSRLDIEINQKQKNAYLASRYPRITATGDYKYNAIIPGQVVPAQFFGGAPGTYATVQFGVPYNLSNTVQLTQILYNPQVNYGLSALEINQKIVEIQSQLTTQEVRQQVASTFFNLQAIGRQILFVEGNISNMDKLISNLEKTYEQGLVIGTEVDKLKISRLSLLNNQQSLNATKFQLESLLRILIGLKNDTPISLLSDDMIEKSILIDKSSVSRPELLLIQSQQEMNAEERKGTSMSYLPSLSFYGSYNYTYNMKPADDFRVGINSAFIGLRLDWTLFDGFEKYNKQKMNLMNKDKLNNQLDLTTQQLNLQTENAKNQIEIQTSSLNIAKEQLTLATRVYDQSTAQYNLGTISTNELIQADNGLQQAQTNVVAAYIQLRQAELTFLRSIGNIK